MMQNYPCGVLPSSFSSSRSRWNTKCKRDAAAPPIWLRRALNDATNTDSIGSLGSNDAQPVSQQSDMCERHPIDDRAALDANRDRQQWRQQPAEGIGSEDASDLYFNPHVFSSRNNNSQQTGTVATSVSLGGGGYASIHAAVSVAGSRTVQSARRTRIPLLTSLTSDSELAADHDSSACIVASSGPTPTLSLPTHSRATPRIGTPVSHPPAAASQGMYVQPMRDELATFRQTHLHQLRQMRSVEHTQDHDEGRGVDAPAPGPDGDIDRPTPSATVDVRPVNANGRRLSRAEERHLREWAGTLCVPSEAMDLGLALKVAAPAPTTFAASGDPDHGSSAPRPSGLRRADPNGGFSGDLSSTLATRPPRARPSSLDRQSEPSAAQPAAPSRDQARSNGADAAFNGDLASVLSGARRQVRPSSLEVRTDDAVRAGRDGRQSSSAAPDATTGGATSAVWQGDLSSVLGGSRHRLRTQLEEARREMGHVGPVRQVSAPAAAGGSWMLPAAAAARDSQQQRQQQQRTGASATAPFADSMFWPEGQDMSYEALLALDRAAIQKGVPKSTLARIKKKRAAEEDVGQECAVCMDCFEAKQWLRKLPCGHVYHDTCVCKWFEEHVHCPLCRFDCVQNKPAGA